MTRPLWRSARLPAWLSPSLTSNDAPEARARTRRLTEVVRQTIIKLEGPQSVYLRALDSDDTRHALDEVTEYNAFTDGFLLLPTLESMYVFLPPLRHDQIELTGFHIFSPVSLHSPAPKTSTASPNFSTHRPFPVAQLEYH